MSDKKQRRANLPSPTRSRKTVNAVDTPPTMTPHIKINIIDILDAFPFYVLLVDENHFIIEANNAVYKHLGVHRNEVIGKYCPRVIHGYDQPFPGCPLEEAAEKNQTVERELFDPDTGRWLTSSVYPTRSYSREGKRVFLHIVTDITERKQAQEQLKLSHQQLRNLSGHLESIREDEKREIARDLHDETSQLLASLYAHIEAAIETLPENSGKAVTFLRTAQKLSTKVLDEIYNLIHELRPAVLDELGLVVAVKTLIEERVKTTGLTFKLKTTGRTRRLPSKVETMLFRVIQESLNNIVKHAHAHEVNVIITFNKSGVIVNIKDDGLGFETEKILSSPGRLGMGLLGMRERVELINGNLIVKSKPGEGTQIIVDIPRDAGVENG